MDVQDYLQYSAKITPDGDFFMVEIDGEGWEGALSQGRTIEEAQKMAEALIFDYVEGLIEFKRRIPKPTVIKKDRYIINIGYDAALKIMLRNTMYDKQIKQADLARLMNVTPQALNAIISLRKNTNLNRLGECFKVLGAKLKIEVQDE